MKNVVVFGVGQVADVIHYYIEHESDRRVAAFTVDGPYLKEDMHLGVPVVAFQDVTREFPAANFDMFVAVSYAGVNSVRTAKANEAVEKGYHLISHISPRAIAWSGFELKPNTFIMENNVIQPYVSVGQNVIMWSGNHIGHHTTIEDNCFLASQIVVSGSVIVGEGTFIGVNATIRDNVVIGKRNVIGASALILKSTEDEDVFIGDPATKIPKKSSQLRNL